MFFKKGEQIIQRKANANIDLSEGFIQQVHKPYLKFTYDRKLTLYVEAKSNEELLNECIDHVDNFFLIQRELYFKIDNNLRDILFSFFALLSDALHNFNNYIINLDFKSLRGEYPKFCYLKSLVLKYIDNYLESTAHYKMLKNNFFKL